MQPIALLLLLLSGWACASVGDYVASGLGLSTSATTSTAFKTPGSVTGSYSNTTTSSTGVSTEASHLTTSFQYEPTSSSSQAAPSAYLFSNGSVIPLTGNNTVFSISTFHLSTAAPCWSQWNQYWSASFANENEILITEVPQTRVETYYNQSAVVATETFMTSTYGTATYTNAETFSEGDFAYSTSFSTATTTIIDSGSFYTEISTNTADYELHSTSTYLAGTDVGRPFPGVYKPNCTLPPYVPECQASWSEYILSSTKYVESTSYKPACTNADVTGSLCSTLVSEYLSSREYAVTQGWPTTTTFAPGCTLGCQTCAITGDKVQLLYWPPATSASFIDGNSTVAIASTAAPANSSVVVTYSGTELTSPTIYISYHMLYASDSCRGIGPTIRDTIVPLTKSADLQSIQWDFLSFDNHWVTEPFNFTDLIEPIPQSIYNKQPSCAQQAADWVRDSPFTDPALESAFSEYSYSGTDSTGWWEVTSGYDCPRTAPYAPIIAVPMEVRDLDPAWASCTVWYGGLYDPPKALQGTDVEAMPTVPSAPSSTAASPSSSMQNTLPSQTAGPTTAAPSIYQTGAGSTSSVQTGPSPSQYQSPAEPSQAASAPASYQPSAGESETGTSSPSSQDAGGAIASILGQGTASSSEPADSAVSSAVNDLGASTSPTSDPSDPGASSAASDPSTDPTSAPDSAQLASQSSIAIVEQSQSAPAPQDALSVLSAAQQSASAAADPGAVRTSDPDSITAADAGTSSVVITGSGQLVTFSQLGDGTYAVGSTTMTAGQVATLDNDQVVSAGPSGLVMNGLTIATTSSSASAASASASGAVFVANGETFEVMELAPGEYELTATNFSTTVTAGQVLTLTSGDVISAESAAFVVNGQTTPITALHLPSQTTLEAVLTEDGAAITGIEMPGQTGVAVVQGSTLLVNGPAVTLADGAVVSLASDGIVDGSQTAPFSSMTVPTSTGTPRLEAVFTEGGQVDTAIEPSGTSGIAIIDGSTLSIGGAPVTLPGGQVASLGSHGLVEGTQTIAFSTAAAATGSSSLPAVVSGMSSSATSQVTPAGSESTSSQSGARRNVAVLGIIWAGCLGMTIVMLM